MAAADRSARPSINAPSPPAEVLPPPVSGAPTGTLRVLVGVGEDGPVEDGPAVDGPAVEDGSVEDGSVVDDSGIDGAGIDDSCVGAVAVGELSAMTGGGNAEVVAVRLPDGIAVGVV